jgi:hypothetical protein
MAAPKRWKLWTAWGAGSLALGALLAAGITLDDASGSAWRTAARSFLLPGPTSHGHYQIELQCNACHSERFADREAMQKSCMECHGAELKEARDSHPRSKFTDPRNADRAALLDAAYCVTCHVEHRPEITHTAGVTLPLDYCVICHRDVGKDRPSHQGMAFSTCASSGCHNFHDNRALYEDFLVKHAQKPDQLEKALLPERDFRKVLEDLGSYPFERYPLKQLAAADADAGGRLAHDAGIESDWLATAHARSGVNCSGCHAPPVKEGEPAWIAKPGEAACSTCHAAEAKGFLAGRHGMRVAQHLPPMTPGDARLPMQADAHERALGCTSCHAAHRFDTRKAAVESCTACHADGHTRAYEGSPHHTLWVKEQAGELPPGSGVTCATCHLPRVEHRQDDVKRVLVQHNQNDTLRPNEKMIRPVCMNCHGLKFSIDALADARLVAENFRGRPARHVESIEMALESERRAEESRRKAREAGG